MKAKHWTERKKNPRKSMYQQTIGNPFLRAIAVSALFDDLSNAKSEGMQRFVKNELISLGEGDYTPADEGMHWSDNPR